jgi:cytochrome c oxidase subunit 2
MTWQRSDPLPDCTPVTSPRQRRSFGALGVVTAVVLAFGAAACGGSDGGSDVEAAVDEGRQLAARNGCAGCHGANGEGGVGPAWVGLLGSQVQLNDGTTVVADEAYLTQSIKDPASQIVAGASVAMPVNQLSDEDIAKIVAYISSLGGGGATTTAGAVGPTAPPVPIATPPPNATAPGG